MAQDIREMFKNDRNPKGSEKLPEGHLNRFEARLEHSLHAKKKLQPYLWYKIAAVFVIALGIGFFFFSQESTFQGQAVVDTPKSKMDKSPSETDKSPAAVTLADVSPEFKKIEDYYMANLNLGLAKINITKENKALIDAFMAQLSELDKEYGRLNSEVSENGPDGATIEALINNLQLRLDLMFKLKNKLDELKKERNENYEKNQA